MSFGSQEFLMSCAAIILYDGGADITVDNLNALVTKSGNKVEPYWGMLYANFCGSRAIKRTQRGCALRQRSLSF